MGIEPTRRRTDVTLGFEDRGEHQHLNLSHVLEIKYLIYIYNNMNFTEIQDYSSKIASYKTERGMP